MVLGIFGFCVDFCGKVLMLKNEFGKVSEFLEAFKIGFDQQNWIWSKFELNEIWKFWTVATKVFGEMGCGYYLIARIILVGAGEL